MRYVTISTIARRWNVSLQRVQQLLSQGRIKGARRIDPMAPKKRAACTGAPPTWEIPEDAQRPERAKRGELLTKQGY
jgi:hypothetical protein